MKFLRLAPVVLLFYFGLPAFATSQETWQFRVILTLITDLSLQGGSGILTLTEHSLTYQIETPNAGGSSLRGPGPVTSNAPRLFPLEWSGCSENGCGTGGELTLSDQQIQYLKQGLLYVDYLDTFRGQIVPTCVSHFRPAYEITFPITLEGRNPTNRIPPNLRWGRGSAGWNGDVFSYEFYVPAQYAPYSISLFRSLSPRHGGTTILLGKPVCEDLPSGFRPVDARDLENLPACVIRGSYCFDYGLKQELLSGAWSVFLDPAQGFRAFAALVPEDTDGDGIPDYHDLCPDTSTGSVVNANGCSIDQLAPCAGNWRNHGDYLNRVKAGSADFLKQGLITEAQARNIQNQAAQSDCGKR